VSRQRAIYPTAIFFVGLLAYANSLGNGFTFDDFAVVVDNPVVAEAKLLDVFTTPYWPGMPDVGHYRPLTVFTFVANRILGGSGPSGFHLTNVALHLLNASLLFWLIGRMVRDEHGAGFGALLFLLHPVHTEAVNSVVGRAELVAAFCVLTALALYIGASEAEGRRQRILLFASVLLGFLGCLAKEQAALLVVVLIGYDLMILLRRGTRISLRRFVRFDLIRYTPYVMAVGLYFVIRSHVTGAWLLPGQPSFIDNHLAHVGLWERVFSSVDTIGRYVWMLFCPYPLSADYAYNAIPTVSSAWSLPFLASLLLVGSACLALVLSMRRKWPAEVGFGVLIVGLFLLPVSNLLFVIGTRFGERLLYLPSVGFVLLVGLGFRRARLAFPVVAWSAAVAVLVLCVWRVTVRNPDWRDNLALFSSAVASTPGSAKVHFNLGCALRDRGDPGGALEAYDRALAIYPDYAEVHYNRGIILQQAGGQTGAEQAYIKTLMADSLHANAWINLGTLLGRQGRMAEAVEALGRARALKPDDTQVRYNYGLACQKLGRTGDAVQAYERVLEDASGHVDAALNLGALYTDLGYSAETAAVYHRALRENPRAYRLAYNLGVLRERLGASDQAIEAYLQAAESDDERGAYALFRAAELYRQVGRISAAREAYSRFLDRWTGSERQRMVAEEILDSL
jgi:protein O-mannosyl-transferase